jgi:hypothetical protein|tara:strand:- start:58 stop:186 length:129 start_codon:yes stop_codon:yes gene_type:complete
MDKERVEQLMQQLKEELDRQAPRAEVIQQTELKLGILVDIHA